MPKLTIRHESWPIAGTFTISRGSKTSCETVVVELEEDGVKGWGECVPYARYGESVETVIAELESLRDAVENGLTREELQERMKACAARNALDCAFWDFEAKKSGTPVWQLAGLQKEPVALTTAYTISLGEPAVMGKQAADNAERPLMKLKLTGDGDLERVAAVRENAPNTRLIVDANEGWSVDHVAPFSEKLQAYGVEMIEQPLPSADDEALKTVEHPITLCADESAHACADFHKLVGKYEMINIKLDKTGGLTEALKLQKMAREADMQVMIGCMLAGSLAMAPAHLIGQDAEVVDLDGPLLIAKDRDVAFEFEGSIMKPAPRALWR
ncbi:N-acetyl-D-Glu racemase DgcA [Curvivirga sp.]|uniref:N-acetyl-D-Glu racemase DgcA n=1 Tax=Curvivirga sp. TaxID=2856848 RepID=UPI003B593EDC